MFGTYELGLRIIGFLVFWVLQVSIWVFFLLFFSILGVINDIVLGGGVVIRMNGMDSDAMLAI